MQNIKKNVEIELRYLVPDRNALEREIINQGGEVIAQAHVVDHWFVPDEIKTHAQQSEWFDVNRGCAVRICEQDNGYIGKSRLRWRRNG